MNEGNDCSTFQERKIKENHEAYHATMQRIYCLGQ